MRAGVTLQGQNICFARTDWVFIIFTPLVPWASSGMTPIIEPGKPLEHLLVQAHKQNKNTKKNDMEYIWKRQITLQ